MSVFSQGHALLIGVGADLSNTVTDAEGLATILKDPARCAYPPDQVSVLTEEKAARQTILTTLDQLAQAIDAESTVIVYFSGHGYEVSTPIGKQYFLMPHGYDTADLPNTAISGAEFMAKLEAIKAQKMLILLDCCHAGGIEDGAEKAPGIQFVKAPLPEAAAFTLTKGRGRVIISSCKAREKSYTGDPYSQFTQALLEAFTGANRSKEDGYVRAADLALYAAKTVPVYTRDKQNPVLHFDQADNFVVAYYAAGDKQPKGMPSQAQRRESTEPTAEAADPKPAPAPVFDQRKQTVGGNQTNIAGNVNTAGGMFNSGTINTGGGGFAAGAGSKAGGAKSVITDTIQGDVFTGDNARKVQAGTYVEKQDWVMGNETTYGDKVAGDKVAGDKVAGDKYTVGHISGSHVAIGRSAQTHVDNPFSAKITHSLQPIVAAVQVAPLEKRDAAMQKVNQLQQEAAKGNEADDETLGDFIQALADVAPGTVTAIRAAFREPPLMDIVGPATRYVLKRIERSK